MSPEPISGHHIFLVSLIFLIIIISPSSSQSNQLQALLKFKSNLINSSNTQVFTTWNENSPFCNFTGIICNRENSVKEINLSRRKLAGVLDFASLCELKSLEKISLGSNLLHGNISSQLSNCINLKHLDLGKNHFSGEFPDISSLIQLQFLDISLSGFSGQFPWKSLTELTNLTRLSLGDNHFDKTSFPLEVLNLFKLQTLYLTNCSIEGMIPNEIENLGLLKVLELSGNDITGPIPDGITKLVNLEMVELYDNQISGILPSGFGNLVKILKLDISNNSLEGDINELRNMTLVESLQLFENKFSGGIPLEFGEFKFLKEFSIYSNMFTGELPAKFGPNLEYIDVSSNMLNGTIPLDMCKNGKFEEILMIQNNFTGGLPETYANCSSLFRVRLSNNSLSGRIPDGIWSLPNLRMLDLAMNQFEGQVMASIGEAKSLAQLFISNNRFSGKLPQEISEVSSLVEIELMYNQFSGEIPARIGDLKVLNSLHFEGNFFSGIIPESISSCVSLNEINLAENSLSGNIPASIGSLTGLNSLNLSGNKLSGMIPTSLSSLRLSLVDLSNNMLIGRVPESLLAEADEGSFVGNPGLCGDRIKGLQRCPDLVSHKSSGLGVAGYCFIAGGLMLALSSIACFVLVKSRQKGCRNIHERGCSWDMKQFHAVSFNEDEILQSLKEENLIGKGGSGNVYKVKLGCGNKLAVKHMWKSGVDSVQRKSYSSSTTILPKRKSRCPEYDAEVATLSSIRHVNVVKLYCSITSDDSNLLVYEYMANGSLWDQLHAYQKIEMDWKIRYEIAMGAAKGLEYLHHGCDRPILHRDVKSSNILLDEEMKAKIADFGLAKIVQTNKVADSSHVITGTHGYIAPEYGYTFKVNEKSDIYSFGVVLMELVTGKKPVQPEFGENKDIACWVRDEMSKDNAINLVDPNISDESKKDAVEVLTIAIRCTMRFPAQRPSMRMVVQMLEQVEPHAPLDVVIDNDIHIVKD